MLNLEEERRYSRHLVLPEVGLEGQEKLKSASVLVVGVGGLGSPLAMYLAAAGVGKIGLIDDDVVDISNLQRQVLYATSEVGKMKVEQARARLLAQNPHIEVEVFAEKLTSQNALTILKSYDIVADGSDNFPTRYLVNDACVLLEKPNVHASIFRFEGQVSVFGVKDAPCYRCLFPEPPPPELVPNCAEAGVIGALAGVIGSVQALEVMKLILGVGEGLVGRMWMLNTLTMQSQVMHLSPNPQCPICGALPKIKTLEQENIACAFPDFPTISLAEWEIKKEQESISYLLLDVREPFEYEAFNIGGYLLPLGQLRQRLSELEAYRDAEIVVHCATGKRSRQAQQILLENGFSKVLNLIL